MRSKVLLISLILFNSSVTFAKFFVEPYVGLAKQEVHILDQVDLGDSFSLGAKAGFTFGSKYFIAGDYMQAGPFQYGSLLGDAEITHTMLGAGFGADYKIIRFWLGYYFDNTLALPDSNSNLVGSALKVGFGLVASKKFRANLELVYHNISEINQLGFVSSLDGVKVITTMVTLSVPVNLK